MKEWKKRQTELLPKCFAGGTMPSEQALDPVSLDDDVPFPTVLFITFVAS